MSAAYPGPPAGPGPVPSADSDDRAVAALLAAVARPDDPVGEPSRAGAGAPIAEAGIALDRIVGEAAGRLESRRAWLRTRLGVVVGTVALTVLVVWVVASGIGATGALLPAGLGTAAALVVGWWYREATDLHRFAHLRIPPDLAAWSREVTRRGTPMIGHAQELQALRRRLRSAVGRLGRRGVWCTLRGRSAAAHNIGIACRRLEDAHEAVTDLVEALARGSAAVAHFAESCEGDPAGASTQYGRLPVDITPDALGRRIDRVITRLAHASLLAVEIPVLLGPGDRADDLAAVAGELPELLHRVERCSPEVVRDGRRLLRAVDRLHRLATRRALSALTPGSSRWVTFRLAAAVTVLPRRSANRPPRRTAFVRAAADGPTRAGWRSVARASRAAVRPDRRLEDAR